MDCKNHPGVPAAARCGGCSEGFCPNCLVQIQGRSYCGDCKVMAIPFPPIVEPTLSCREANEALLLGILSIPCFGIILGPIAIFKAIAAKKSIARDPRLRGAGKATAGLLLGIVGFTFFVLGMIAPFAALHAQHRF
jgi:hypothetical protein